MSDDDLGKRVTQVPGFEWKVGMVSSDGTVGNLAPTGYHGVGEEEAQIFEDDCWHFTDQMSLDLDHPANTGFLLEIAFGRGEHLNHALARAIIAAAEDKSCA